MKVTIYTASGRIQRVCEVATVDDADAQLHLGEYWIEGAFDDALFYVVDGEAIERAAVSATWDKTTITANGTDAATLSGLPAPCVLRVDSDDVIVDDGVLVFTATAAGRYVVELDAVDYLPQRWVIHAN